MSQRNVLLERVRKQRRDGEGVELDDIRLEQQLASAAGDPAAVFADAEQPTDAFLVGVIDGERRLDGDDVAGRRVEARQADDVPGL